MADDSVFVQNLVSSDEIMLGVHGDLGYERTEQFQDALNGLLETECSKVTLNLAEVRKINTACIGKMLAFRKSLAQRGKRFGIRGCSEGLHKLFNKIRLDKLIRIER